MCEGRFPGRIVLYWAPSWILLLPFGPKEGCSNWQSFTISQHWWRFWGSHSCFSTPTFFFLQLPKDWFWNYSFAAQCVHGPIHLCALVRICGFACARTHAYAHTRSCTCTCLNASLGNCLNGIRGDYGSCWGMGLWEWHGCHTRTNAHTRAHHAFMAWTARWFRAKVMVWWVTWSSTQRVCEHNSDAQKLKRIRQFCRTETAKKKKMEQNRSKPSNDLFFCLFSCALWTL